MIKFLTAKLNPDAFIEVEITKFPFFSVDVVDFLKDVILEYALASGLEVVYVPVNYELVLVDGFLRVGDVRVDILEGSEVKSPMVRDGIVLLLVSECSHILICILSWLVLSSFLFFHLLPVLLKPDIFLCLLYLVHIFLESHLLLLCGIILLLLGCNSATKLEQVAGFLHEVQFVLLSHLLSPSLHNL